MKIFTSFDTQRCKKLYLEKVKEYDEDKIIVLQHCSFFWYFNGFVRLLLLATFLLVFLYYSFLFAFSVYVYSFSIIIFGILVWIFVARSYISYKMNFVIVTPDAVYTHIQNGLFFNTFREIPTMSIRNVEVLKNSFLGNIFGYGNISLSSDIENSIEGRKISLGVIYFPYVNRAYEAAQHISKLLYKDS